MRLVSTACGAGRLSGLQLCGYLVASLDDVLFVLTFQVHQISHQLLTGVGLLCTALSSFRSCPVAVFRGLRVVRSQSLFDRLQGSDQLIFGTD